MHVQVPTNVVRNEDEIFINNGDFLLYTRLCLLYFKNYKNEEIKIDHKRLMLNIGITDTRTLKKRLLNLHKNNLIKNKIDKLPKRDELVILFNSKVLQESKHFTKMNANVFNYLEKINEHAFRLLFYYKSHINLKDGRNINYCFVGMETLKHNLKMGGDTIQEANEQLRKSKLVKIVKHKLTDNGNYNEDDELIFDKYNNHYIVSHEMY